MGIRDAIRQGLVKTWVGLSPGCHKIFTQDNIDLRIVHLMPLRRTSINCLGLGREKFHSGMEQRYQRCGNGGQLQVPWSITSSTTPKNKQRGIPTESKLESGTVKKCPRQYKSGAVIWEVPLQLVSNSLHGWPYMHLRGGNLLMVTPSLLLFSNV